jgi:uncharacterized membrane protein YdbT with pleckstrin-like domain
MTMTDRYLTDDEQVVLEVRRHSSALIVPAIPMVIAVLAVLLGSSLSGPGVLSALLGWVGIAGLLWLAWRWAEWWVGRVVITDTRIFEVSGLIIRKVAMMPLAKVTDLGYRQSLLGRLLGYGGVRLESAGQVQDLEHIDYLPNPEEFYRQLIQRVVS